MCLATVAMTTKKHQLNEIAYNDNLNILFFLQNSIAEN